uniref:Uncharacterized protein n=1 Tax=Rhizophora mucronata TaxID=61149 RepID=A0A2P2Q9H2_RHIMU
MEYTRVAGRKLISSCTWDTQAGKKSGLDILETERRTTTL